MYEGSGHATIGVQRTAGRGTLQRGWTDQDQDDARVQAAIVRAKAGDRHAVRFLYTRYADTVRRYVAGFLGDAEEAQDITQTVFLKLLTKLDRYEPRACRFDAWLLRVARNTALDEARRRRPVPTADVIDDGATADATPEVRGTLTAALARLPAAQREVLVLRHLVGLSCGEIADRLERTESSINNLHHRGRSNFRRAVAALDQAPTVTRTRARGPERHVRRSVVRLVEQEVG